MTAYEKYRDARSKVSTNDLIKNRFGRGLRIIAKYDIDPWVEASNNLIIVKRATSILDSIKTDDLSRLISYGFAYNKDNDRFTFDTRRS